jgi:NAD(P)-dependent dehydrogenase (short-subunit alcohol dehydrogenase family)
MVTVTVRLDGKCVLITGASGGLGGAVVKAFLDAGASVAGTARQWKEGAAPAGEFLAIGADLTREDDAARAVAEARAWRGRLDAVVHLMGGFAMDGNVEQTQIATWDRMMSVNLRAAFLVFRAALPALVESGAGRVIAVGARAGETPGAGMSAYAASKAGLHALVKVIAAENRRTGVTANAVLPSTIDTAANRAATPGADFARWVAPESIAALLVWLASEASRDVNGALMPIYGRA